MNTEPAITIGSVLTLVGAAIALLVAFGVDITDDQQKAILAFVAAAGPLATGLLIRGKVSPVAPPE